MSPLVFADSHKPTTDISASLFSSLYLIISRFLRSDKSVISIVVGCFFSWVFKNKELPVIDGGSRIAEERES